MNFSSVQTIELVELAEAPPQPVSVATGAGASAAAAAALECLSHGVAVFDARGSLAYCNLAARSAISRAGWALRSNQLVCAVAEDAQTWRQALRSACLHGRHGLLELQAQSGNANGTASVYVSLTPVRWAHRDMALASFEREELCGSLVLQQFSARHRLTSTEGQVLQKLCQGLRPADIAVEHGVSPTTVLTQVAAIRIKTGCNSVQGLLNKLSRLPSFRGVVAW